VKASESAVPKTAAVFVAVEALTPWAKNPRKNDPAVKAVADSIKRFGFGAPLLARQANGEIIAGHTRLKAAIKLGLTEVPVRYLDLTESEAHALALADNKVGELAEWDDAVLAEVLKGMAEAGDNIEGLGWSSNDIQKMITEPGTEDGEVMEPPAEPITKPGDLWLLGDHRLLCGDSTKAEDVERLLAGESVSLIMADPPYFAKVDADWDNDFSGYEGFLDFLRGVFATWAPSLMGRGTAGWWCAPDFAWHIEGLLREHFAVFNHIVWHKGQGLGTTVCVEDMRRWRPRSERLLLCEKQHSPDSLLASFNAKTSHIAARSAYENIIGRLIEWQNAARLSLKEIDRCLGKNGMAGHYFTRSQWALPTEEAWAKLRPLFAARGVDIGEWDAQRSEFDAQRREFDAQRREFDAQQMVGLTDVWESSAPVGEDRHGHPTPKPLAMISKLVSAHSRPSDLVADPFLGSGTTLIAAEQLGRKCYGMELSPAYCDVIIHRWETLTGKKATLDV
jgi:DNA modification methylase